MIAFSIGLIGFGLSVVSGDRWVIALTGAMLVVNGAITWVNMSI